MNLRPSGYEPDELPDCSTPRHFLFSLFYDDIYIIFLFFVFVNVLAQMLSDIVEIFYFLIILFKISFLNLCEFYIIILFFWFFIANPNDYQ